MDEREDTTRRCPLCQEDIRAGAVRCKHCHADILPGRLGAGRGGPRRPPRAYAKGGGRRPEREPASAIEWGPTLEGHTCPAWVDDDGWFGILYEEDDGSCTYEEY